MSNDKQTNRENEISVQGSSSGSRPHEQSNHFDGHGRFYSPCPCPCLSWKFFIARSAGASRPIHRPVRLSLHLSFRRWGRNASQSIVRDGLFNRSVEASLGYHDVVTVISFNMLIPNYTLDSIPWKRHGSQDPWHNTDKEEWLKKILRDKDLFDNKNKGHKGQDKQGISRLQTPTPTPTPTPDSNQLVGAMALVRNRCVQCHGYQYFNQ